MAELKQEALNAGLLSSVGSRGRGGGRGGLRGRGAPWAPRGGAAYSFMRSGRGDDCLESEGGQYQ